MKQFHFVPGSALYIAYQKPLGPRDLASPLVHHADGAPPRGRNKAQAGPMNIPTACLMMECSGRLSIHLAR